jgi:type I restriction enzyme S subunit
MSRLQELIENLCPDGVESSIVGTYCTFRRGDPITKDTMVEGEIPVIAGGQKPAYYCNQYNRIGESVTLSSSGAYAGYVAYWDQPIFVSDSFTVDPDKKLNTKYLYYLLKSKQKEIYSTKKGAGVPHVLGSDIAPIKIKVPPLPVQEEIVRILDTFMMLDAELKAELKAREKQYAYYREELLTFLSPSSQWKKLGEVADVTKLAGYEFTEHIHYSDEGKTIALRGLNVKNGHIDLGQVKYIDGSNFSKLNRSKLHINDMLFTYVGTVGQVALIDEEERYYLAPNVARIRFLKDDINPVFMRYYFQTIQFINQQVNKYMQSSSMKNLTMENIRKFLVPVPPIEEQAHIVNSLDRFEAMTHSLKSGLPAEIAARHKQYEYYRDQLLTFQSKPPLQRGSESVANGGGGMRTVS